MLRDATIYARYLHGTPAPEVRGAEWVHHLTGRPLAQLNKPTDPTATVAAYVNHGRWVVECPDCHGAQLACKTDHRFLCDECGNVAVGNRWRPVEWPGNAAQIDRMLTNRPIAHQNWSPGEAVELLAIDNLENTGKVK